MDRAPSIDAARNFHPTITSSVETAGEVIEKLRFSAWSLQQNRRASGNSHFEPVAVVLVETEVAVAQGQIELAVRIAHTAG